MIRVDRNQRFCTALLCVLFGFMLYEWCCGSVKHLNKFSQRLHNETRNVNFSDLLLSISYCTENESTEQGALFNKLMTKYPSWTACYADDYVIKLYHADQGTARENRKLFFDVGSNKGYVVATWMSVWKPRNSVNPRSLGNYLSDRLNLKDCGVCGDCNEIMSAKVNLSKNLNVSTTIHAFEPQPSTFSVLCSIQKWTNDSSFHVHNLALSNKTGTAQLTRCDRGIEWCGLSTESETSSKGKFVNVNVTTLDEFVKNNNINDLIDILKIDAEGFDPLVLDGARWILKRRQVRLLIFEHNAMGFWNTIHLRNVIHDLDDIGYACYMLGRTGIARLTRCWSYFFEIKRWSNILCVSRDNERLHHFIQELLIHESNPS